MSATVFHEYGGTVTFWIYGWISLVGAVIILYLQKLVSNGKEILALDEDGTLYLIEPNPEKFVIKESRKISDSPTWAHLAITGNQIFVRELEALACYQW